MIYLAHYFVFISYPMTAKAMYNAKNDAIIQNSYIICLNHKYHSVLLFWKAGVM